MPNRSPVMDRICWNSGVDLRILPSPRCSGRCSTDCQRNAFRAVQSNPDSPVCCTTDIANPFKVDTYELSRNKNFRRLLPFPHVWNGSAAHGSSTESIPNSPSSPSTSESIRFLTLSTSNVAIPLSPWLAMFSNLPRRWRRQLRAPAYVFVAHFRPWLYSRRRCCWKIPMSSYRRAWSEFWQLVK